MQISNLGSERTEGARNGVEFDLLERRILDSGSKGRVNEIIRSEQSQMQRLQEHRFSTATACKSQQNANLLHALLLDRSPNLVQPPLELIHQRNCSPHHVLQEVLVDRDARIK